MFLKKLKTITLIKIHFVYIFWYSRAAFNFQIDMFHHNV